MTKMNAYIFETKVFFMIFILVLFMIIKATVFK